MKMMFKNLRVLLFVLASITILSTSSCTKSPESGRKVLTFWQFWTDPVVKPTLLQLIREFENENPDIKVEITDLTWSEGHQKIVVAFGSGNPPDVLELGSDWVPEFFHRNVLWEVTKQASEISEDYLMWEPVRLQDKYFGFPWFLDTRVIFFNKDLMKRAGLDPESTLGSWPEFLNACQRVNDLGEDVYGFGANSAERHRLYKKFLPFLWSNGGKVLSDDGESSLLSSPEALEALEFYLKLVEVGKLDTQRNLDEAFMRGQIGFIFSGGWLLREIPKVAPDLNFGVTFVPSPDGQELGVSFAGGEYLVISKKSQHKNEALRLINFLINPDNALRLCKSIGSGFPAAKVAEEGLYDRGDPHLKVFYQQLRNSRPSPVHPKWVYIEEVIERELERAMYGKATPSESLKTAEKEIEEIVSGG
jgi:multiple sugar transport system substrate-binding protein